MFCEQRAWQAGSVAFGARLDVYSGPVFAERRRSEFQVCPRALEEVH